VIESPVSSSTVRFALVAATVLASIARTPSNDRVVAARSRQMKVLLLPVILRISSHGPADSARRMRESYLLQPRVTGGFVIVHCRFLAP
jgi:hypothetical protein